MIPEPETPSPDAQAELLKHVDVQAFMNVLNDLLTGKKKLVIESVPQEYNLGDGANPSWATGYTHTFKVEDCK